MITYRVAEIKIHISFTLELGGGEWSGSQSGRLTSDTNWIGSWVDHLTFNMVYRLNAVMFSTFSFFYRFIDYPCDGSINAKVYI